MGAGGRVFLTGGTGLVGSHVAELLRAEGYEVRALHRASSKVTHLQALGCELVEGTLQDGARTLGNVIAGCDALVHSAAVVYSGLSWPRVRAVNVEGTEGVFLGAARAGVPRAVHLSSVAAYGASRGPIDESAPLDTPLRPVERYARSKRESERVVAGVSQGSLGSKMAVVILRPSVIYGERDRLFTPKLVRALELPLQFLLGDGHSPLPAVYAGNLAHAVLAGLREPLPAGSRPYNVAEDHPVTQRQLYAALASAMGTRFRPVPLPASLVLAGAKAGEGLGIRIPGAEELSLRRAAYLAVHPNPYCTRRIRDELGWSPPISLGDALARTAGWVRETRARAA